MIFEYLTKVKNWVLDNKSDLYVALIIFLVGMAGFGLGRLSVLSSKKDPIRFENMPRIDAASTAEAVRTGSAEAGTSKGAYVASKQGSVYHFPWCAGAQRIKEENKIWFQTKAEAEARGLRPAANCPGLE